MIKAHFLWDSCLRKEVSLPVMINMGSKINLGGEGRYTTGIIDVDINNRHISANKLMYCIIQCCAQHQYWLDDNNGLLS